MIAIDRSILTDLLMTTLEPDAGDPRSWLVGDHQKPPTGGWQGEAGHSDWLPYMILTATPSTRVLGDFATANSEVWFGYAVTSVGKSRRNAEKISHAAQERLASLQRQATSDGRTISRAQVIRYGGVEPLRTEPPLYLITDQYAIYTTK